MEKFDISTITQNAVKYKSQRYGGYNGENNSKKQELRLIAFDLIVNPSILEFEKKRWEILNDINKFLEKKTKSNKESKEKKYLQLYKKRLIEEIKDIYTYFIEYYNLLDKSLLNDRIENIKDSLIMAKVNT